MSWPTYQWAGRDILSGTFRWTSGLTRWSYRCSPVFFGTTFSWLRNIKFISTFNNIPIYLSVRLRKMRHGARFGVFPTTASFWLRALQAGEESFLLPCIGVYEQESCKQDTVMLATTKRKRHRKRKYINIERNKNQIELRTSQILVRHLLFKLYSARLNHAQNNMRSKLSVRAPRWVYHASLFTHLNSNK